MQRTASTSSSATPPPSIRAIPRAGSTRTSTQLGRRRHPTLSLPRLRGRVPPFFPPPLAGEGQGGGFRLTPLRRPDRSGVSDSLSGGSGFFERSIAFQGSSWWRCHSETFLIATASGRRPSLACADQVIG